MLSVLKGLLLSLHPTGRCKHLDELMWLRVERECLLMEIERLERQRE